ncbi:MAG: response regulator [Thermodesulfobacteriota bacterium]
MITEAVNRTALSQILVVDDTPANLKLLAEILKDDGYHVRPATSGRLALRSVAIETPDLILLDVKMPDMDGYEVCRRLKSDERTRNIPVIFVSALDEVSEKVKGFEVGAVDYITKPFQSAEVLARVETHLTLRSLQAQLEERNLQLQREVNERIRTESALRESEARMRLLIDRSPLGIAITREGSIFYANPALVGFLGLHYADEIIGRPLTDCLDPGDWELVISAQQDITLGETLLNATEVQGLRPNGDHVDMTLWQTRLDLPEGASVLVFAADTSEDKILRAQLLQAQKMEAVATLTGGIAHEFNNLLTIISGYAELLLAEKKEEDSGYQDLQVIAQSCQRGRDLVSRLITFGRNAEPSLRPVSLNREVERMSELLQRTLPRMIDIELRLDDDLKMIDADAGQVEQILLNLALNARDAMPEGGQLTFETRVLCLNREQCERLVGAKPGDYAELTVSDTGHGIDAETLEHIFEPFYTTRGLAQRSGLGLAVVYALVKAHGGYIACSSRMDEGTVFRIYFPIKNARKAQREESRQPTPRKGTETVLLVDDETLVRDLGKRILSRAGYTVLTAANGEEALAVYEKEQKAISLVILDLIMPGMGGRKCLKELHEIDPKARVLICSGVSLEEYLRDSTLPQAGKWVRKPYNRQELLQAVRDALDAECGPGLEECRLNMGMQC